LDVALPASHARAHDDSIDLRDLETDSWITGSPDGCCALMTLTACAAAGFTPQARHHIDDWQALSQLVSRGHGVALIPRMAQHDLPRDLVIRPVAEQSPRRHLVAAAREGAQDSPLLTTVLGLLADAARQAGA